MKFIIPSACTDRCCDVVVWFKVWNFLYWLGFWSLGILPFLKVAVCFCGDGNLRVELVVELSMCEKRVFSKWVCCEFCFDCFVWAQFCVNDSEAFWLMIVVVYALVFWVKVLKLLWNIGWFWLIAEITAGYSLYHRLSITAELHSLMLLATKKEKKMHIDCIGLSVTLTDYLG